MKRLLMVSGVLAVAVACNKGPETPPSQQFASSATTSPAAPASSIGADKPVSTTGVAVVPVSATVASTPAADASARPADAKFREVTLPAGTVLAVDLETPVGSDISRVEQPVNGRLRHAVMAHGVEVLPAGAAISGHVTSARRPGKVKGRGLIAFRFTQLDTPGEGRSAISTATISRQGRATKEKDTLKIVGPAAAGAVIGRIAGGKGAARKGAVIGGAAGTGYVLSTRGEDVRLGKGANLAVKLTAPLSVRVPIGR
jgi:hypothetical protein